MPATHKENISDTIQLIIHTIPIHYITISNHITIIAKNLVATLQDYSTAPLPGLKIGDSVMKGVW